MIPRDHAEELEKLTDLLTGDGWEQIDLGLSGPEATGTLEGISFRLISSPGRQILLTANWRGSGASTSFARLDPDDPRTALWHAEAVNMPINILISTARAALARPAGPGPMARLGAAGWIRQPPVRAEHGVRALVFRDPAAERWAAAQYLVYQGRLERGPWLIARDDLETARGRRAYAHTDSSAPGTVIAALALTDSKPAA